MPIRVFDDPKSGAEFILSDRNMGAVELSPGMREGVRRVFGEDLTAEQVVDRILADVRQQGDEALRHYTKAIDQVDLDELRVSAEEFTQARESVPAETREALRYSAGRIRWFHERQHVGSWIEPSDLG
ncbi:MAG: histidinol dehydrogenase, partial [Thermomicrobiales bacterium]